MYTVSKDGAVVVWRASLSMEQVNEYITTSISNKTDSMEVDNKSQDNGGQTESDCDEGEGQDEEEEGLGVNKGEESDELQDIGGNNILSETC